MRLVEATMRSVEPKKAQWKIKNRLTPKNTIQPDFSWILSQLTLDDSGRWHSGGFVSRKMILVETWYETHDGKLLALVEAFKTWHRYLEVCHKKPYVASIWSQIEAQENCEPTYRKAGKTWRVYSSTRALNLTTHILKQSLFSPVLPLKHPGPEI